MLQSLGSDIFGGICMNRMYYLFSRAKKLEAIYICENDNYIDKPTLKTSVYNMGTLLSRAVRLLTPWYENAFNFFLKEESVEIAFSKKYKEKSSFSCVTENDDNVRVVFETMLRSHKYIIFEKEYNKFIEWLGDFMNYINLCQEDDYYCYSDYLNMLLNQVGYRLPPYSVYTSEQNNLQSTLSKEEIKELLKKDVKNRKVFDPVTVKRNRKLFEIDKPNQILFFFGTLEVPVYVYEIHDILDLIAVSLECIWKQKYVVKKCKFCGELFVTHNRARRYCPNQGDDDKNCQEHNKLEQQLFKERTVESRKVNKNIRSMLIQKLGESHELYKYFLKECQNYRDKIKSGEIIEEEYVTWMNKYWEDVKAKFRDKKAEKEKRENKK